MQIALTAKFVERPLAALLPGDANQIDYWDTLQPGFGLRISAGGPRAVHGTKTYQVRYRVDATGERRRMAIGNARLIRLSDARSKAKAILVDVENGRDPAAAKASARKAETFGELSSEYIERHAKPNKRSWRDDERILNVELLPYWQNYKAKDMTRAEVRRLIDDIRQGGAMRNGVKRKPAPVLANRTLALARKIFNFGIERCHVENNPCYQVKSEKETSRERFLTNEEVCAFWAALDEEEGAGRELVAAFFRLRLLTAQRGAEVLRMRWSDVVDEGNGAVWTIPGIYTKNKLSHRVPLTEKALAILEKVAALEAAERNRANEWRRKKGLSARQASQWVFRSERDGSTKGIVSQDRPMGHLRKAFDRIRLVTGAEHFTPHDLRRTFATKVTGDLKIPRESVAKVLNHVDHGVTKVYDRYSYDDEKRAALEAWDRFVAAIVTGMVWSERVVTFGRR